MDNSCENCMYSDLDYVFDGDNECEFYTCDKGYEPVDNCPHFERYKPKKYMEQSSKCDNCDIVYRCVSVIEVTTRLDTQRHFVKGLGCRCPKEEIDD